MARIACDIDSTLYDFCGLACRVMGALAEERGDERLRNAAYATSWAEWRTPIDLAGEEAWNEVVDICHSEENILKQTPYDGASWALWDLHDAGHELVYVSNRSPATHAPTFRWLGSCGFPFPGENRCTLLCHTDDKLGSILDCQYLIDDRPKTLVGFVTKRGYVFSTEDSPPQHLDRKAFGLVTPYNRGLTDVPNIYLAPNWPLLGAYLRAKIPSEASGKL